MTTSQFLATVKRNWRTFYVVIALVVDSAAILGANLAAYRLHNIVSATPWNPLPPFLASTAFFWGVGLFLGLLLGLYRAAYHVKMRAQYLLGATVYFYTVVLTLAILFATRQIDIPRTYLILFYLCLPIFFLLFRVLLNRFNTIMQGLGFGVSNTVIVEYNHRLDEVLFNRFTSFPELGYRIVGHVKHKKGSARKITQHEIDTLSLVVKKSGVQSIFIPTLDIIENGYSDLIKMCEEKRVRLKVLSQESDDLLRFVYVKDIAGISLYSPPRRKIEFLKRIAKRTFDIAGALLGLVLFTPLVAVVIVAILLEDGRPVFFLQRRGLTKGGKEFSFVKFRSMKKGAEQQQEELYKNNKTTGGLFLIHDDPRLTRVGRLIRKYSIDELPQLFNVIKGDMSLVGPRPLTISDLYNIAPENQLGGYYKLRERGKPGMTGLWQISGRREVGFREMVLLDLYYIENQTILFDLEILALTIPVVLFGRGGY